MGGDEVGDGIIPAYAGSTATGPTAARTARDHPRIRGEHAIHRRRAACRDGSSPHTRGARVEDRPGLRRRRIIPAYAGSTPLHRIRDYGIVGSSPHTRGAPQRRSASVCRRRIIPAYAGSTSIRRLRPCSPRDHPRIRGEHPRGTGRRPRCGGSSPHTRGAPQEGPVHGLRPRIIPAYAGSTHCSHFGAAAEWDHPRIRGEHDVRVGDLDRLVGSSPHTRGAHRPHQRQGRADRIIPAYAGSTRRRRSGSRSGGDHPRIRGEHGDQWGQDRVRIGSSPHTRGALRARAPRGARTRIIPAYAGST